MKKNKIVYAILFVILIVFLSISSASCSRQDPQTTVRITINSWPGFGPLYIAKEQGIFEKNGINARIIRLEDAPDRRAALMSNRVDIVGSTLDDLAVTLSQGVNAIAFACADFSNGGDGIIAAKEIDSLDKLINTSIAVQPGFVNHFFLLYVLDQNGLSISNLKLNPMRPDDAGAAFILRNIDAAVTWEPHLSRGLSKRPGSVILASSADYPGAIFDIFIAERSWFDNNPEIIDSFRKSWDEALDYLNKNMSDACMTIGEETGFTPTEVKDMLAGAKLIKNCDCQELLKDDLPKLINAVNYLWREAGYIRNDIDLLSSIVFQDMNK